MTPNLSPEALGTLIVLLVLDYSMFNEFLPVDMALSEKRCTSHFHCVKQNIDYYKYQKNPLPLLFLPLPLLLFPSPLLLLLPICFMTLTV